MDEKGALATPGAGERVWPRAAALVAVTLGSSVLQPSVLLAIPFLLLIGMGGLGGGRGFLLATLAMLVVVVGPRDGIWYVERAWALLIGGFFAALTLLVPAARVSTRALGAVFGAAGACAAVLWARSGAWEALDWAVTDRVRAGVGSALEAIRVLRSGEALSPALVTAVYETAEAQAALFPAMTGIASMAALAVAWWAYVRVAKRRDRGLGPLRDFRFNDHLVWVFIAGLLLVVTRWGDGAVRVGANAMVFMGALYALRGAAVFMFLSGGLTFFGYAMVVLGLLFVPPVLLGGALLLGLGDTWLDVRARAGEAAS